MPNVPNILLADALRCLVIAAELTSARPLPLRIENRRRTALDMAIKLARETLAVCKL